MNVFRARGLAGQAGCRACRRDLALPVLLALSLVLPVLEIAPAKAQQAPISLFPPTVEDPPRGDGVDDLSPRGGGETLPPGGSTLGETPQYEGIQVDQLQELDTESLGILEEESGGLGLDAWAGSDRQQIDRLIAALPAQPASSVMRALTTRLLLTNARAPQSGGNAILAQTAETTQGAGFLRLRAERLYAMGDLAGLNRLLSVVPQRVQDSWLAQARVEGLLLAGEDEEACLQVGGGVARFPAEAFWGKAQVLCQFIAGQPDQAFLALDLLREADPDSDPLFYALTGLFIGGGLGDFDSAALTPLTMAMLRVGDASPPADFAEDIAPLLLHGVEGVAKASAADRAAARETLVQAAILPGEDLAEVFDGFAFEPAELADPLVEAEAQGGIRGRALLFHAASRESIASAKAEFLLAAMTAAEGDGRGYAMAQAVRPQLRALAPSAELAWFAPTAARSFYRVGQFERAAAWAAVLRLDGVKNPQSQAAYEALNPMSRLAGGGMPIAAGGETGGETGAEEAGARLLLAMILSRALDQEEPNAWPNGSGQPMAEGPALKRLPTLLALGDAAATGRRGETVLLAAVALGEDAGAETHPLALAYAVSALRAVGLGGDARALALEAAAGAGL